MSYILDALKKAERDRLREQPKDFDDLTGAHWDPYQPTQSPRSVWSRGASVAVFFVAMVVGIYFTQQWMANSSFEPIVIQERPLMPETDLAMASSGEQEITISSEPEQTEASEASNSATSPPAVVVAGYVFIAEDSAANRLFVGDGSLRQGDMLDAHWLLESINETNFVLRAGDRVEVFDYR